MDDVTQIIEAAAAGDEGAATQLFDLVYARLRTIAVEKMAREAAGQTLQPTALVHEAWLRLGAGTDPKWENRAHFFGAAAEAMRRILVERARRKQAARHGGGVEHVNADTADIAAPGRDQELLALNESLDRFALVYPTRAELVKLHFFVGLTFEQAGEVMNISERTAKRWWTFSKAWLYREMTSSEDATGAF
ncbi:MAG: RNA polymerase subunit sigma [Verrucomicrobiales bacterium]|nr:RNA polymerase subunit sigma [Verrucomicrobiales bacterium]